MLQKLKHLFRISSTRPVFVIGSGRSGTHWLGYAIGEHPEVRATIEVQPAFGLSTKIALDPTVENELFEQLVTEYKRQLLESTTRLYLDKSHPNIWIAEKLKNAFPNSLFVGIERNAYATVASMMKHKKVSAWHKRWREFPIPNRFLGITEELADIYDTLPLSSQCAIRWLAHHDRMNSLKEILGDSLFLIPFESLAYNTEDIICELQQFLGLHEPIPIPDVKTESLNKWKSQLSADEVLQIQAIVGFSPPNTTDNQKTMV